MDINPYTINIPKATLDDLQDRLARTRWPDELPGVGGNYGVPLEFVMKMVAYWRSGYDWRKWEARLNQIAQFTTTIDNQNIYFLHVRSSEPDALPLIMTHSWPGSVVDYLDVIGPLSNPRQYGGNPADAFHLVIPSIPGYGFSGPTHEPGWDSRRIARAWAKLMKGLGYSRYGVQGNDAGSIIAPEVGRFDPDHVAGVHVTQLFSFPSGDPAELSGLSEKDLAGLKFLEYFSHEKMAFNQLQATQPQTLAYALTDSPVGQLAWNAQILGEGLDPDYILTNVMIYWLTATAGSSARHYYEDFHAQDRPSGPTTTPTAVAVFPDDFRTIRRLAERDHKNIVHWTEPERGGHYAAHQAPDLLVADLRDFFRSVR